jgi:hypothetical protein
MSRVFDQDPHTLRIRFDIYSGIMSNATTSLQSMRTVLLLLYTILPCSVAFRVLAPPNLAGIYTHVSAEFGPTIGSFDYTLELMLANPLDACSPLVPPTNSSYVGKAVLALRGQCQFGQKAETVLNAGGLVLALGNNDPSGSLFPMMLSPGSTTSTALSFMILFNDYVRLGAALSHANSAQGFETFSAALQTHVDHVALTQPRFSGDERTADPSAVLAALHQIRKSYFDLPHVAADSATPQTVIIRTTSVGEDINAWNNYWNGFPNNDVFGNRPWMIWVFRTFLILASTCVLNSSQGLSFMYFLAAAITLFVVLQLYCCVRFVRSGALDVIVQRFGFGAQAEAQPVNNNNNVNVEQPNPDPDNGADAQNAAQPRRPSSYGAVMATLPPSASSVNSSSGYVRMSEVDQDEQH